MRQLILVLVSIFALPSLGLSVPNPPPSSSTPIDIKKIVLTEEIAKDAYLWGYPLVRFARTKKLLTTTPGFGHAPLNTFFHADHLPTPDEREISTPLPDTLYSSAILDLRNQAMVLQTPKIRDRFYSLQVMDAFANNLTFISSRTRGEAAGKFFITGPHYIGATPPGFEHIHSSTNFVWIVGHIAADSPSQVKSAYNYIRKYNLRPYNVYLGKEKLPKPLPLTAKVSSVNDPRKLADAGIYYFNELGIALQENDPANLDAPLMERFRTINVGYSLITSEFVSTREMREAYERAIASGEMEMDRIIKKDLIKNRNGWNYVLTSGEFNNYSAVRAALSKAYFGESSPIESIHPVAYSDYNHVRLNGNFTYIIHFAKDKMPPAGAFWSLSSYKARERSLVKNNLNRYALGSYSKNMTFNSDGSLDIYISANEPSGHLQNWLPAPRGNFYVMMSIYNPTDDVITGKYTLPSVQRMTSFPISG
ncbi:MAG: DUF1254 domain-containing protein [Pseudobdellovibrionaceae bacterium]